MSGAVRSGRVRSGLGVATSLALVLGVSGCELFRSAATPEVPLFRKHANGALNVSYRRSLVAPSRRSGEPFERGEPAVDVRLGRVFVGSSDHGLYALAASDGRTLWRFETGAPVQSAPVYDAADDVVYFGSDDGALYKLRARDGALLWRFATNAEVRCAPVLDEDGRLYLVNGNDTLLAIDATTGKKLWGHHRTPPAGMVVAGHSGPLLYRSRIYVGWTDGTVGSYDARTGVEQWSPPIDLTVDTEPVEGPQYLDVDTTPIAGETDSGPAVFVATYGGGVFALDAETGTTLWSAPELTGVTALHLWSESGRGKKDDAKRLLVGSSGTSGVWAVDVEDGQEIWRRSVPDGGAAAVRPVAGALLVTGAKLGLALLSPISGEPLDALHVTEGISSTPVVVGRRAFVLTNGGTFMALVVGGPGAPAPLAEPANSGLRLAPGFAGRSLLTPH